MSEAVILDTVEDVWETGNVDHAPTLDLPVLAPRMPCWLGELSARIEQEFFDDLAQSL